MAGEFGTKETSEVINAMGDTAVVVYKAQKSARKADGSFDVQALAAQLAAQLMGNPQVIDSLKAAFDGIKLVPSELKDLSLTEILQLATTAGLAATKASQAIKE